MRQRSCDSIATHRSQNDLNQNFQIFRTLDFKYANSAMDDQVEEFILKWFADEAEAGKKLRAALEETGKERIKYLAQNPLRLTLLCNIWQRAEGLPDTQTGLYERFVKYLYQSSKVSDAGERQLELDRVMGTLANYGINKPSLRFRFTEMELQWLQLTVHEIFQQISLNSTIPNRSRSSGLPTPPFKGVLSPDKENLAAAILAAIDSPKEQLSRRKRRLMDERNFAGCVGLSPVGVSLP
jgi:hypothetical protein